MGHIRTNCSSSAESEVRSAAAAFSANFGFERTLETSDGKACVVGARITPGKTNNFNDHWQHPRAARTAPIDSKQNPPLKVPSRERDASLLDTGGSGQPGTEL